MLNKTLLYFFILWSLWIPRPEASNSTDFIIRAQDDKTLNGLKLNITIPNLIHNGPSGDNIEVISNGPKAVTNEQGHFTRYSNVDISGNMAPKLLVKSLKSVNGKWPPTQAEVQIITPEGKELKQTLPVSKDDKGISFVFYENFTYDLPYPGQSVSLRFPFALNPYDSNGNPLFSRTVDQMPFFDDVSTFGTVWAVFNMYEKDIKFLVQENSLYKKFQNRWEGRAKVTIYPHMTQAQFTRLYPGEIYQKYKNNAFYDYKNGGHILCFFPLSAENSHYTCQSFDVVAHEAGHNILNILRPDGWGSSSDEKQAFHESFGDVTALFSVLTFADLRQKVLQDTKSNLHNSSFLSVIGERIANRNANECTTLSVLPSCEPHKLSERLTRAMYGIFADLFTLQPNRSANILERTATTLRRIFLKATLNSTLTSFVDFGKSLLQHTEQDPSLNQLIFLNFMRQGIDLNSPSFTLQLCLLEDKGQESSKTLKCSTGRMTKKIFFYY